MKSGIEVDLFTPAFISSVRGWGIRPQN